MDIGVIEIPTKKELFVRKMEEQILSGKLKAGDSLPSERQLQEETRISKTMVHAGLAELVAKGFLEVTPRRGAVVANYEETGTMDTLNALIRMNGGNMTRKQTHSFMEARIAIEGSALRRLAENHTDEDIAAIAAYFDYMVNQDRPSTSTTSDNRQISRWKEFGRRNNMRNYD